MFFMEPSMSAKKKKKTFQGIKIDEQDQQMVSEGATD